MPAACRLGFKKGGKVQLTEDKGRLVLTPVPADPIAAVTGFLKGKFSLAADLRRQHLKEARHEKSRAAELERLIAERETRFEVVDGIRSRLPAISGARVQRDVAEAVKSTRCRRR